MKHHHRGLTQVIKYRGGLFKKQRQVVLNACSRHAIAHVFVNAAAGGVAVEQFAPTASEQSPRSLVHRELSTGQQTHLGHGVEAALGIGVEGANRIDLVIKQINPVGHQRSHGKEVNQAATHRVLTRTDHLRHMAVARHGQLLFQLGVIQPLLDFEMEGVCRQKRRWRQTVQSGGGRHQHHIRQALRDTPQGGQTLADQILVRRKTIVGQGFPIGEQHTGQVGLEKLHFFQQTLRIESVGAYQADTAALRFFTRHQSRQQSSISGTGGAG